MLLGHIVYIIYARKSRGDVKILLRETARRGTRRKEEAKEVDRKEKKIGGLK